MSLDDFNQEFGGENRERGGRDAGRRTARRPLANCPPAARDRPLRLKFTVEGIEHNRITRVLVERLPEVVEPPQANGVRTRRHGK
jgi:hypothetical protein